MPSVSAKQHRAMEAAAHGKSTIGIPKKVGKEFSDADEAKPKKKKYQNGAKGFHQYFRDYMKEPGL